ncbi:MAG: hypothetical protein NVS3B20_24480 [Polyangiales bacterium]
MPLLRLDQLHDLVRRTIGAEGSMHPSPLHGYGATPNHNVAPIRRPRVVVVEPEAHRRIDISRALIQSGFDVEVVATPAAVKGIEAFHAIVMSLDSAESAVIVETLIQQKTRAGLITYDEPSARQVIKQTIDRWPNDRISLVARDVPAATLSARVKVVLT